MSSEAFTEHAPFASPLTTKGDVYVYDTADQRLGVGSNNQALIADSTAATGLNWGIPTSRTMLGATTNNNVGAGATEFVGPFDAAVSTTTETAHEFVLAYGGTLRNLFVRTSSAQPASKTLVITVRVNGASSIITTTVAAGSAAGNFSDITHTAAVAQGDRVCFQMTETAGTASATIESISVELDG